METQPLNEKQKMRIALNCVTVRGFKREFYSRLHQYERPQDCFWALNVLYIDMTGTSRFKSWDSARVQMGKCES